MADPKDTKIPDAEAPAAVDPESFAQLQIGPPFAISDYCALCPRDDQAGIVGCVAVVKCDCGQLFKLDLLAARPSQCPQCGAAFTHVMLVTRTEDDEMVYAALATILRNNGFDVQEPDDDDDDQGDGDDDDDQGDGDPDDDDDDDQGGGDPAGGGAQVTPIRGRGTADT